jgi:hypothetical protein
MAARGRGATVHVGDTDHSFSFLTPDRKLCTISMKSTYQFLLKEQIFKKQTIIKNSASSNLSWRKKRGVPCPLGGFTRILLAGSQALLS